MSPLKIKNKGFQEKLFPTKTKENITNNFWVWLLGIVLKFSPLYPESIPWSYTTGNSTPLPTTPASH